jgi:glycosyltransferase involved in cell wall biosynthesis
MVSTTLLLIFAFSLLLSSIGSPAPNTAGTVSGGNGGAAGSVTVVIPLAGNSDMLVEQLRSICDQTLLYRHLVCVTRDSNDPAAAAIASLMRRDPRVVHLCAGETTGCCQKNHNLLAGYEFARAAGGIVVFCDGGHFASRKWLENLVAPLLTEPGVTVSSGYHHVFPGTSSLAITCRAVCVATLHFFRRIKGLSQPWGGATAIRVADFDALQVAGVWSGSIVDDVALAAVLKISGRKMITPRGADMQTFVSSPSFDSMTSWLTRQIAYIKYIFPISWLLTGIILLLNCLGFISALTVLLLAPFCSPGLVAVACSLIYLFNFSLYSIALYHYHPGPGPALRWYLSCVLCCFLSVFSFFKTAVTAEITWGDRVYRVGAKGKVIDLRKYKTTK